ncbi:hypothetical protein [Candidatus Amarolinea dominans]|uniref:hypothetical protein n=1 Tax=Candidatus Amarolinea dominans TaxID=3140696 RepID=UPI0031372D69|nr:hypothetical protein [Anaerolineae bacterium]
MQGRILKDLGFFPVVGGVSTTDLPAGTAIELAAVSAQANSADALPALLPVGLEERGGEISQMFRNAFDRVVLNGEQIANVLPEEPPTCKVDERNRRRLLGARSSFGWPLPGESADLGLVAEPVKVTFFSTQFVPVESRRNSAPSSRRPDSM